MDKMYCVKCQRFTETKDVKQKTTKNNRQMLQGICVVCGTKKSKFISTSGKGFLNDTIILYHLKRTCPDIISPDLAQS